MNNFWLLMNLAYNGETETNPLRLGNTEFWKEENTWCYSLPVAHWTMMAIAIISYCGMVLYITGVNIKIRMFLHEI